MDYYYKEKSMTTNNSKPHDKQFKENIMYVVQNYTIEDGWINELIVHWDAEFFDSLAEAINALDEYLHYLDDNELDYNRSEYRIHFKGK